MPTNASATSHFGTKHLLKRAIGILMMAAVSNTCLFSQKLSNPLLSSIVQINDLLWNEPDEAHECAIEGVVGIMAGADRVLLQDEGEGLVVHFPFARHGPPPIGSRIRVEGVTIRNVIAEVQARRWQVLDRDAGRSVSQKMSVHEALNADPGWVVELRGLVQAIQTNRPPVSSILRKRLSLQLRQEREVISVVVPLPSREMAGQLRLSKIKVRGVLQDIPRGEQTLRVLWTTTWDDVEMETPGWRDPFAMRVTSLNRVGEASESQAVRLRARVLADMADGKFPIGFNPKVRNPKVWCWRACGRRVREGDALDLLGFPRTVGDECRFEVVDLRRLALPGTFDAAGQEFPPLSNYVAIADSVTVIRSLTVNQLDQRWPVRLQGTVSYRDEEAGEFFVQRDFGGVRVKWRGTNDIPGLGQTIRLCGHAVCGVRHPTVIGESLELMSQRNPLLPRSINVSTFAAGGFSGGRILMRGIVRSVRQSPGEDAATFRLDWDGHHVRARLPVKDEPLPGEWVDARVEVAGLARPEILARNSYPEEVILISDRSDVKVLDPAPKNPFEGRLWTIREVLKRSWRESGVRRLRLRGVITATHPVHILDDGSGGIELRHRESASLEVGDEVEVVGFPCWNRIAPHIGDFVVKRNGRTALPDPISTSAGQVTASALNGRRIRLAGMVIGHSGETLDLRVDDLVFAAVAPDATKREWPDGALVEVVGVCQFLDGPAESAGFRVLLAGPDSVALVNQPSSWKAKRMATIVGGALAMSIAALGWALFFRFRARQSQSQLLTTFHANPMPAWIIRRDDFRCVEMNLEFERMFNLSREELLGRRMNQFDLWVDDADRQLFLETVSANPSQRAVEARLRGQQGQAFDMLLSSEPVRIGGDECLLIIANDLTERLKLLEQLRQAQKMEAVGQLAAGVAHDFNNLLTVVRGNSGLIRMKPGLDDDTTILTREIEAAGGRAAELTGQLLAYSRKSVMQPRDFDLNEVIRSVGGMLNRMIGETINVVYECSPDALPVNADPTMLDQVLLNLGVNSRDAMPDGGRFSMTAGQIDFNGAQQPGNPDGKPGRYATVTVTDTGCGMSEDVLDHVFDPFFTTKEVGKGTGLGLSTAYGILRQHEGWIDVESSPGQGAKFTIYLPLTSARIADEPKAEDDGAGRGHETILVVEDHDIVRQTVDRVLSEYGYQVLLAEDGPAAEQIWQDSERTIDLVLTDLVMPRGLSGLELSRRLRAQRSDLKVIYMTGHSQELIEHGGQLNPGVDFLPKPFENAELVRMVRSRLDECAVVNN